MRRGGIWFGVLALAAVAAACSSETGAGRSGATAPPRTAAAPATAETRPATDGAAPEIPAVLTVEHEVDVTAERDGVVVEVAAEEGAKVESGATLARLDSRQVESELEQARADLKISQYNVQYNEAELHASEAHLERSQMMFKDGLGSKADLDEAEFRAKGSAYDLESWKANVEKRHAQVHALELEMEKTHVRAPFSGLVSRRYVRQGEMVTKGTRCYRLSQLSPLLVEFQVPETDPHHPAVELEVSGTLVSDSNHTFEARITRVSPVVDAASGSYEVTAVVLSPSADMKPGMAVHIQWKPGPVTRH